MRYKVALPLCVLVIDNLARFSGHGKLYRSLIMSLLGCDEYVSV